MNAGSLLRRAEAEGRARRPADRCSPTCGASSPRCPASQSFITPVQNLRIGGRHSKSQYQFVVQGLDQGRARALGGAPRRTRWAATPRPSRASPPTSRTPRLQATVKVDRDKARALGITADQLRSTLYTGFGTRQVSTIYETGDSYEVIIEFDPRLALDGRPARPRAHPRPANGKLVPLSAFAHGRAHRGAALDQPARPAAGGDDLLRHAAGRLARRRGAADRRHQGASSACRRRSRPPSPAPRRCSRTRSRNQGAAPRRGRGHDLHRARHPLRELHPPADDPDRPAGGGGRRARRARARSGSTSRVIAIIGILMLIGIVKKNAIMMIDFALAAAARGGRGALRGDPRGVPAALPPDHDDDARRHHGRAADRARRRRRAPSCASRSASRSSAASSCRSC